MYITKILTKARRRRIKKTQTIYLTQKLRYEAEFGKEIVKFYYDNFVNIFIEPKLLPVAKPLYSDFNIINKIGSSILLRYFLAILLLLFITPTVITEAKYLSKGNNTKTEINGPTPWPVIGNMYSQPNNHILIGRNKLDYYGSGDVNNDEKIDSLDETSILGATNDRADIDGDGIPGTEADKSLLTQFNKKEIEYLPGHWNKLKTKEERISWIEKMLKIQDMTPYFQGYHFVCADYIRQMQIDFNGLSNIDEFIQKQKDYGGAVNNPEHNARFNLPFYYVSTENTNHVAHAAGGFFVGDGNTDSNNVLNFDDWYFVNYYEDKRLLPGDFDMDKDAYANIRLLAYRDNLIYPSPTGDFDVVDNLIKFNLEDGIGTMIYYTEKISNFARGPPNYIPLLVLDNPNDDEVQTSSMQDLEVNYQNPQNLDPNVTGKPDVIVKNSPLEAIVTYKDTNFVPLDSLYPNYHYTFTRIFYAVLSSGGITNADSTQQRIEVKDMEAPSFDVPNDTTITWDQTLDSTNTGSPTNIKDNSGLPISRVVEYVLTSETDSTKYYNAVWTLTDVFGNDSSQTQKVAIDYTTDVSNSKIDLPLKFNLSQNYPNPFNPNTTINYTIAKEKTEAMEVKLIVYNLLGEEIAEIVNTLQTSGNYKATFNASKLPSGLYFYKLSVGNYFTKTKKMLLIK